MDLNGKPGSRRIGAGFKDREHLIVNARSSSSKACRPQSSSRARGAKHNRVYNPTRHRLREIEKIVRHRHGVVPDTDDADIYLDQAACCLLHMMWNKTGEKPSRRDLLDRLNVWCEGWAPDVSIKLRRDVVRDTLRRPRRDKADECAERLRLGWRFGEFTPWSGPPPA
jgi:hypothetical protein